MCICVLIKLYLQNQQHPGFGIWPVDFQSLIEMIQNALTLFLQMITEFKIQNSKILRDPREYISRKEFNSFCLLHPKQYFSF